MKGDKNSQCLVKVKELVARCQPGVITLEDTSAQDSRRGSRIRALTEEIITLATKSNVTVKLFTQKKIREAFFTDGKGTKDALAEIVAKQFPDELAHRLPPKRRSWKSEDSRMGIFDAVALAMMCDRRNAE